MCNLYTLAPWEVRHLIQHYTLIGREFEEAGPEAQLHISRERGPTAMIDAGRAVRRSFASVQNLNPASPRATVPEPYPNGKAAMLNKLCGEQGKGCAGQ
jgi:hypothetical protein